MRDLEQRILSDINMDHESLNDGVKHLTEWLSKQPHLPNVADDKLLQTFIIASKSVERAKDKLEKYFITRSKNSSLYLNRDPLTLKWHQFEEVLILPNLTQDDCNIVLLIVPKTKQQLASFDLVETCRAIFMMFDLSFRNKPFLSGQYVALDCSGVCAEYILKFFTAMATTAFDIYQNSLPVRMKAFVLFNASPAMEKFTHFIKYLFGEKLRERVHVHSGDHTVLSKYFSLDSLPKDYNGNGPSIKQIKSTLKEQLEANRDWFMNEGSEGAQLNKIPPKNGKYSDYVQGTFRKLQLD